MKFKRIHFVGIKGAGMTPLAILAKEAGATVTGSDVQKKFITDAPLKIADIHPQIGFSEESVKSSDLVIRSSAHGGEENIEVKKAKELGIRVMTLAEALGHIIDGELFGKKKTGIAVAGTHGKTTTTGLIATIMTQNKLDPSYFIGTSEIPTLSTPGHFGKGKYFVVEADEYAKDAQNDSTAKFLTLFPDIAVFTNIDYDHVDIYNSLSEVSKMFTRFLDNIPDGGVLIACGDDQEIQKIIKNTNKRVISYGFSKSNDYIIQRVTISTGYTFFHLEGNGADLGEFALQIMGEHNCLNALAAVIVSLEVGISLENIKKSLKLFTGSKRRFELKGQLPSGALLYDDYAHHPTEIRKTLETFKKLYPRKKIVLIFQPHTFSRTKKLFEDFLRTLSLADEIVLPPIYGSLREVADLSVSSEAIAQRLQLMQKTALTQKSLSDVVEYVKKRGYNEDFIVITMGAGDVYEIDKDLLKE